GANPSCHGFIMPDDPREKDQPAKPQASRTASPPAPGMTTVGGPIDRAQGSTGPAAPARAATDAEAPQFIERMKTLSPATKVGRGRLVFAMDATLSREPTWDLALGLQAEMFKAVKEIGGLDVQLVYFRGFAECRASKWVSDPEALARLMTTVRCM